MSVASLFAGSVEAATFLRFTGTALLIELTPGPNMGYLAIVSAQRGQRAGLIVCAGVALGLSFYLVLTLLGIAEGIFEHRFLYEALRWAGIAYMLWLAREAWRSKMSRDPVDVGDDAALLARGLLTNLLNVKAAIFYAVLLPAFLDLERGQLGKQATVLGGTHIAIATTVHVTIVLLAAGTGRAGTARLPRIGKAYAIGLVAVAIWLAWSTRASR